MSGCKTWGTPFPRDVFLLLPPWVSRPVGCQPFLIILDFLLVGHFVLQHPNDLFLGFYGVLKPANFSVGRGKRVDVIRRFHHRNRFFRQLHRAPAVPACPLRAISRGVKPGKIIIGEGIIRLEADGGAVIVYRPVGLALVVFGIAAVVECEGIIRLEADGGVVIVYRPVVLGLVGIGKAAVVECESKIRLEADGGVVVGYRPVVLALLFVGNAASIARSYWPFL